MDDPPGNLIPAPPSFDPFKPEEHATLGTTVNKDIRKPAWEPKTHHLKTSLVIGIKSFLPSGFAILEPQTNGKSCIVPMPNLHFLVQGLFLEHLSTGISRVLASSMINLSALFTDPTQLHGYTVTWLHGYTCHIIPSSRKYVYLCLFLCPQWFTFIPVYSLQLHNSFTCYQSNP